MEAFETKHNKVYGFVIKLIKSKVNRGKEVEETETGNFR